MSKQIQLFRKRLIPEEIVELKDDKIIKRNQNIIITKWKTLKPRTDFSHGISCYFLDKGIKVSKFIKADESLYYWYCDIIKTDYIEQEQKYIFTDLLADVVIMPDGFVKVLDLDELAEATKQGLLSSEELQLSLIDNHHDHFLLQSFSFTISSFLFSFFCCFLCKQLCRY